MPLQMRRECLAHAADLAGKHLRQTKTHVHGHLFASPAAEILEPVELGTALQALESKALTKAGEAREDGTQGGDAERVEKGSRDHGQE